MKNFFSNIFLIITTFYGFFKKFVIDKIAMGKKGMNTPPKRYSKKILFNSEYVSIKNDF